MRWIAALGIVCLSSAGFAKPPVPRAAREFTIMEPSGKQALLSSYRGKVVLVQFLYTTCAHCQAAARIYGKLQAELGARGLQVAGVAFNPEAQGRPEVVRKFVEANRISFPVGTATPQAVMSYLGISVMQNFVVPEILIIDRNGIIRAQSEFSGSAELQDEAYLRRMLEGLLKERKTASASRLR